MNTVVATIVGKKTAEGRRRSRLGRWLAAWRDARDRRATARALRLMPAPLRADLGIRPENVDEVAAEMVRARGWATGWGGHAASVAAVSPLPAQSDGEATTTQSRPADLAA